jgi:hypothetical protein
MAICGSQRKPKKKSCGGTRRKKAQASQSSETMMPTVVRIATTEQPIMNRSRKRSTPLRARNRGDSRARAKNRPPSISARVTTTRATCTMPRQRPRRSAAAAISGDGSVKTWPLARLWISESTSCRPGPSAAVIESGRLRQSRASTMPFWNSIQSSTRISAGTPTQIAT